MRLESGWGVMWLTLAVTVGTTSAVWAARAQKPETYAATATVKTAGGAAVTAPVTVTITRWTTDDERAKAFAALKKSEAALKAVLDALPQAGTIQVGGRTTALRFARTLDTGGGKLVNLVAAEPILYLGAGVPEQKPKAGYQFAFATFEVSADGKGSVGDLAPAAKLKLGAGDALVVDDYGVEVVRLTAISSK